MTAKYAVQSPSETSLQCLHYMTQEARVSMIYASYGSFLRYAASSVAAYNEAISDIHNLMLRLEAMSQGEQSTREAFHSTETVVRNPEVILTKCLVKRQKNTQGQKGKCSRCGGRGHNVRKCK